LKIEKLEDFLQRVLKNVEIGILSLILRVGGIEKVLH
jgi:hypothetical protein